MLQSWYASIYEIYTWWTNLYREKASNCRSFIDISTTAGSAVSGNCTRILGFDLSSGRYFPSGFKTFILFHSRKVVAFWRIADWEWLCSFPLRFSWLAKSAKERKPDIRVVSLNLARCSHYFLRPSLNHSSSTIHLKYEQLEVSQVTPQSCYF